MGRNTLSKLAAMGDAPTKPREEVSAEGMERKLLTKYAVMKDVPT